MHHDHSDYIEDSNGNGLPKCGIKNMILGKKSPIYLFTFKTNHYETKHWNIRN